MNLDKEYLQALTELQEAIGFQFYNIGFLLEAMAHRSYLNENPEAGFKSNERLEFLGDSIIGFIVAETLFQEFPLLSEGEMTRLRSHIVSQEGLSSIARRMNLGKYLLLSKGESLTGGRDRDSNLARTCESLIGAIFLDKGLPAVKDFLLDKITMEEIFDLMTSESFDFKSKLQEYTQAKYQLTPTYEIAKEEGPSHDKTFAIQVKVGEKIVGRGQGKSKKKAEEKAAKNALRNLSISEV